MSDMSDRICTITSFQLRQGVLEKERKTGINAVADPGGGATGAPPPPPLNFDRLCFFLSSFVSECLKRKLREHEREHLNPSNF